MRARLSRSVEVAATLAVLAGAEVILWRAGPRLPDLAADPTAVVEGRPLAAVAALVRLGALAVGAALLVAILAGVGARALGAARLVARLDRWTPTRLRHLLDGALGVGLAAGIGLSTLPVAGPGATPSAAAGQPSADADPEADGADGAVPGLRRRDQGPPPPQDPTTTLRRLPDDEPIPPGGPVTTRRRLPDARGASFDPSITLRRLPDGSAEGPVTPNEQLSPDPASAGAPADPPATGSNEVVVRPGDSFWRLAERHQAERLGRHPTEEEVGACWQELVALNRHRLAVPGQPDLIFPGQVFQLPCP